MSLHSIRLMQSAIVAKLRVQKSRAGGETECDLRKTLSCGFLSILVPRLGEIEDIEDDIETANKSIFIVARLPSGLRNHSSHSDTIKAFR